jgi:tetratricopeptide (TPR) repeat protein
MAAWPVLLLLAYELTGRVDPPVAGVVFLHGATTPYERSVESGEDGRFRFRKVTGGTYTLAVANAMQTIEVGPGTSDARGRIDVVLHIDGPRTADATVSVTVLSIPDRAAHEFEEAQRCLARRDSDCASGHLSLAVKTAPQFVAAWNALGVIAYQTQRYTDAETKFRRALAADPEAWEPLVNLGGVLLNLERPQEALAYNRRAVSRRPNDALANSQLGLSYFGLHEFEPAEKYLKAAVSLDPSHFSHPQLALAAIDVERGERAAAIQQFRSFLEHHPDSPQASAIRQRIEELSQ